MHFYFQTQKIADFVQNQNLSLHQELLQTNYSLPAKSANKTAACDSPKIDDSLRDVIYAGSQRENHLQFQDSTKKDKKPCDTNTSSLSDCEKCKIASDNCETDTNPICNLTAQDKLVLKLAKPDLPVWSKDTNVTQETEVEILEDDSALNSTSGSENASHCADKKCAELQNTDPMTISTSKENCFSIQVNSRPDLEVQVEICTDEPEAAPPTHSEEDVVSKFTNPKIFEQIANPQVVSEIDDQVDKIFNPQAVGKITNLEVLGKTTSLKVAGKTLDPQVVSIFTNPESIDKITNPKVVDKFNSIESVDKITNLESLRKLSIPEVATTNTWLPESLALSNHE